MTDNAEAARAGFDEIAALAAQERKFHPDHEHYRDVDAALNSLRENVRAYLGAAGTASSLGNPSEAEHHRAQAALIVVQALPLWKGRLESAKTERERVYRGFAAAQSGSAAQMLGAYPRSRGWEVQDAAHALRVRLEALTPNLRQGGEADFNALLDDAEAAATAFRSAIGIARRESRLRVAEERAQAAVSAASTSQPPEAA